MYFKIILGTIHSCTGKPIKEIRFRFPKGHTNDEKAFLNNFFELVEEVKTRCLFSQMA